jgi:DNA replication protein DnaC
MLVALIGPRGTGKTQLSVGAMLDVMSLRRSALYMTAMDVFLWLRAVYADPDVSELDAVAELLAPSLLVIDEVGERGETPFEDQRLTYIIDKRYAAMKDTIVIANLRPEELAKSLGSSIVDRLRECGGIIECKWESFRGA